MFNPASRIRAVKSMPISTGEYERGICVTIIMTKLSKKFNVHGSVHLGNVYVRLKVQRNAHGFVCILYITMFALHVSGAIYTLCQEHKLNSI
jgi:ABC-type maltose transport system permease subunit